MGPALNPRKDVFFARIGLLYPGDQMPSKKLFVDVSVDVFAGKNQLAAA